MSPGLKVPVFSPGSNRDKGFRFLTLFSPSFENGIRSPGLKVPVFSPGYNNKLLCAT